MTVSGTLSVGSGSIYKQDGAVSVGGAIEVREGLVSVEDLTVGSGDRVEVSATGLGSRPGPFRVALVR
jgi:hypothetical protein